MRELVAMIVALWRSARKMRVCIVERDGELVVVIGDS
jgi:hypothetical protein